MEKEYIYWCKCPSTVDTIEESIFLVKGMKYKNLFYKYDNRFIAVKFNWRDISIPFTYLSRGEYQALHSNYIPINLEQFMAEHFEEFI